VSTENPIKIFLQLHKLQIATPSYKYQRKKPRKKLRSVQTDIWMANFIRCF